MRTEVEMSKPRLTIAVLRGLGQIAGYVEAGGCGDVMGVDEDTLDAEGKKQWHEVQRACDWIRKMQVEKEREA
jgi:hypothetical protein